ncbi:MAG TPA: hypothetical protein VJ327_11080 [Patescibacteria group bacterium]|nr:hypothetical protein [Patescibacteria group bacterium]
MHEVIIVISKAANAIREAIGTIERGVATGKICPTCGGSVRVVGDETKHYNAVDCVVIPLEIPGSCENCFLSAACPKNFNTCGCDTCKVIWNKIIDHYKK